MSGDDDDIITYIYQSSVDASVLVQLVTAIDKEIWEAFMFRWDPVRRAKSQGPTLPAQPVLVAEEDVPEGLKNVTPTGINPDKGVGS